MARRSGQQGFSVFLGLVLLFLSLFVLLGAGFGIPCMEWLQSLSTGFFWPVLVAQLPYFLLGLGMGLLADVRAERSLYLWLFLLFLFLALFLNANAYWSWIPHWTGYWKQGGGFLALLLGFFFLLCARYYTLQVRIQSRRG